MNASPRQVVAALLVGVGSLWLLGTLGLVSARVLGTLLAYWPLLLIGLGLDLLLARRRLFGLSFALPFTLIALAAIGLLALLPGGARGETFSAPIGVAQSAEVELELGRAPTQLSALTSTDTLFEATLSAPERARYAASGTEHKRIELERRALWGFGPQLGSGRWDIGLSPLVPLALELEVGSGEATLDLSELQLSALELSLGSSSSRVTLPAHEPDLELRLETGSGTNELNVPAGAELRLRAETGSGLTRFALAPGSFVTLELSSGSGNVEIVLPEGANVQLLIEDEGSGRLELPASLRRVEAGDEDDGDDRNDTEWDEEGRWQTEGFTPGAGQLFLTVIERGSGTLRLR